MSEFESVIELSSLNGTTGFQINGIDKLDRSGVSVANAGDVNGDGFADIIIGALGAGPGGDLFAGESYVVFGRADWSSIPALNLSSLDGSIGFRIDGIDADDRSGRVVSGAGDVNGDGFGDFLIGAYRGDPNGQANAGETYVVFGRADWSGSPAFDLASLDGSNGFRLDGINSLDASGAAVSGAGDVNGDGFADVIVGAYRADPNGKSNAGQAYIVFGKADWTSSSALNLSSLDGSNGFRLDGVNLRDVAGLAVANAGDVNGDGFDDILVGARGGDPGGSSSAGESYVIFGKADWTLNSTVNLATLDGSNGFRLDGNNPDDFSGSSVAGAGDLNGDGYADIIIGVPRSDPGGKVDAGEVYVAFGKANWSGTPVLDPSQLNGIAGFRVLGIDPGDQLGAAVASAGDINSDGFADIIVGAMRAESGSGLDAGESYVIFGRSDWSSTSVIELSTLDGINGFRISGIDAGDLSGRTVSGGEDINGDGFDDIIIGADRADPNGTNAAGETYVIFGRAPDSAVNRIGSAADQYISGGAFDDTLSGNGGNDLLEGRLGSDVLNGEDGNDTMNGGTGIDAMSGGDGNDKFLFSSTERSLARETIDGGAGLDRIVVEHSKTFINASVSSIEEIEFATSVTGPKVVLFAGNQFGSAISGTATIIGGLGTGIDRFQVNMLQAIQISLSGLSFVSFDTSPSEMDRVVVRGDSDDEFITGSIVRDDLFGGAGNDTLDGGSGADRMRGGGGDDLYIVDFSNEVIESAGQGNDTIESSVSYLLRPNAEIENLLLIGTSDINAIGNQYDNFLKGNDGNNALTGKGGEDTLAGGLGNDVYEVTAIDTINELFDEGFDTVRALSSYSLGDNLERLLLLGGNNTRGTGNELDNILLGNSGDNLLVGGIGRDSVTGNLGNDRFDFNSIADSSAVQSQADVIIDFKANGEADTIDLSTIDASASLIGNQAFTFIGGVGFSAEGQIRAIQSGSQTVIEINTTGSAGAEMIIRLSDFNASTLVDTDFIL